MDNGDKEQRTVDVGDKDKEEKGKKIEESQDTQLTQPSQPADNSIKSALGCSSTTPRPASGKRCRSPEFGSMQPSQKGAPLKFGSSCSKCRKIRPSLKLEIAKLKKENSYSSRQLKKLREEVGAANQEKNELRNSVNFLKNMYSNLLSENEKLKSKIAELKKVIIC